MLNDGYYWVEKRMLMVINTKAEKSGKMVRLINGKLISGD